MALDMSYGTKANAKMIIKLKSARHRMFPIIGSPKCRSGYEALPGDRCGPPGCAQAPMSSSDHCKKIQLPTRYYPLSHDVREKCETETKMDVCEASNVSAHWVPKCKPGYEGLPATFGGPQFCSGDECKKFSYQRDTTRYPHNEKENMPKRKQNEGCEQSGLLHFPNVNQGFTRLAAAFAAPIATRHKRHRGILSKR